MKIRTKLQLVIICNILILAGIVSVSLLWQKQAEKQRNQQALVMELNMAIFEQARLREEYFIYREERTKEQFMLKHKQITGLLERIQGTFTGPEEMTSLLKMMGFHKKIEGYFDQLVRLDQSATVRASTTQVLRERLMSQMLVNAYSMYDEGLRLLNVANEKTVYQNNLFHLYSTIVFGLLALFIVTLAVIIIRSITYPLTRLHKGTEIIAGGNLDYKTNIRTPDELGQLSTAFDAMTEHLREITVSRDELNKEIETRRQAEDELRESEEKYRALFENAVEGIFQTTPEGRFISANPALAELFGYDSPQELMEQITDIGRQHYVNMEDRTTFRNILERDGIIKGFETQLLNKDGNPVWASLSALVVRDDEGVVVSYEGTLEDITERKRIEEELKRREMTLLAFFNAVHESVVLINTEGTVMLCNVVGAQRLGKSAPEIVGTCLYDHFSPDVSRYRKEHYDTVIATGESIYFEDTRSGRSFEQYGYPVFDEKRKVMGVTIFAREFTERKRAEEALRESEERYKSLVENTNEAIYVVQNGILKFANRAGVEIAGNSEEEIISKPFIELIHPDDRAMVRELYLRRLRGKGFDSPDIFRFIAKNGNIKWLELGTALIDFEGRPATLSVATDITERRRIEEALRESEEKYRSVYNNAPLGFVFWDKDCRISEWNEQAEAMFGWSHDEAVGRNFFDLIIPEQGRPHVEGIVKDLMSGRIERHIIHENVKKNGELLWCEWNNAILRDNEGEIVGAVSLALDITESKQAEEKIKASLREKEVLLKEIHHRVKNNLQIVSSLLFLQSTRTKHPEAVSVLRESRDRIRSMALIHERLYKSPNLASVDMGEYTRNLVSDLRRSYRAEDSSVRLTLNVDDIPLSITEAIPCGLIINELVSNALKHAFPNGNNGEITIQMQREGTHQITLTVSDNGIGIPESVDFRNSPSFALTLIHSLVEQFNGTIELDRRVGTAFTIAFKASG